MKQIESQQLALLEIIERIIEKVKEKKFSDKSVQNAMPMMIELGQRMDLTPIQALLFSAFVNFCDDDNLTKKDLAEFFDCPSIRVMRYSKDIDVLIEKDYIRQRNKMYYFVPQKTIDALENNSIPQPNLYESMDAETFMDTFCALLGELDCSDINQSLWECEFNNLCKSNKHLKIVKAFDGLQSEGNELLLFCVLLMRYFKYNDEHNCRYDIEDYFDDERQFNTLLRAVGMDVLPIKLNGYIGFGFADGQVDTASWTITEKTKKEFLSDYNICNKRALPSDVKSPEDIVEKELFYNESTTQQINQLAALLSVDRFHQIQQQLESHGMRKGFACIFYGYPGTGKTETVLQLAKRTNRSIMQVEISALRSKWVGETESNVKAVFESYRRICKMLSPEPILLFNEADAVLCTRQEGAVNSVDKMENAMQNIILQEMETLEGIMIATTNLTGNLDKAFERRFLYKIEFQKPTAEESKYIWQKNDSEFVGK